MLSMCKNLTDNKKSNRSSSIELLRIISMVMIVIHHFAVQGNFVFDSSAVTIPKLWYNFIEMGGKIGVDIFVLISGYFLIKSDGPIFNIKKLLKFWGQVFFYSVTPFVIFLLLGQGDFSLRRIIVAFLPITFGEWWFASSYFVLFLVHPFLNMLLKSIKKETFQKMLVMFVICWCIIPTFTTQPFESNSFVWLVCLYCIAAYIRLYGLNIKLESRHYLLTCGVLIFITYLSSVVITVLGTRWSVVAPFFNFFYGQNMLPISLISLSMFMWFVTLKMSYHKWINIIASGTFGVYLLHENMFIKPFLWQQLFKNNHFQNSNMMIPYSIIVTAVVFVVCIIIDLLRQATFERLFVALINRYAEKVIAPFSTLLNKIGSLSIVGVNPNK